MAEKLSLTLVNRLRKEFAKKPPTADCEIRDIDLKGFSLRIRQSAKVAAGYTMVYQMVYARGKRVTLGSADHIDPDQARTLAKQVGSEHSNAQQGLGEDPKQKRKRVEAETYLKFLDDTYKPYLESNLRKGVNNTDNVKETMDCLKRRFSDFQKLALNEITPLSIEKWRQKRVKDGMKPASINRQLNDLRACLNRAVKWGALASSPFDHVEPMKIDSSKKVRFLTPTEELKLRAAIDGREERLKAARQSGNQWRTERGQEPLADLTNLSYVDYLKPAVLISLNTGLRQGELFNLKWSDIDFVHKTLTVVGETAKSGETRHIPLNPEALAVLKSWKNQPGLKCSLVFPGEEGMKIKQPRKPWVGVLKTAKIQDFRWHDLRHTFASNLVMAGVDLNTVRELLGHSDYKMTQRYAHLAPEHKQAAVEKLGQASAR